LSIRASSPNLISLILRRVLFIQLVFDFLNAIALRQVIAGARQVTLISVLTAETHLPSIVVEIVQIKTRNLTPNGSALRVIHLNLLHGRS
jgi:hypothetical protein